MWDNGSESPVVAITSDNGSSWTTLQGSTNTYDNNTPLVNHNQGLDAISVTVDPVEGVPVFCANDHGHLLMMKYTDNNNKKLIINNKI